jgi:cell shape-determining protein MreC
MIYHQRDNRRKRRKTLTLVAWVVCFLVIISLLSWLSPHLFSGSLQTIGRPFFALRGGFSSVSNSFFGIFRSKNVLLEQNADLTNQLALFEAVKAERDVYKVENEQLQALLRAVPTNHTVVSGRILSKPGFSPYDTVLIDGGTKANMQVGNLVLADDALVVGYISSVAQTTATVMLYSSPEEKLDVFIGSDALQAIATGKGGGNFEIRLPQNAGVKQGDIVTLATSSQKILGTIQVISSSAADSFEQILFKGPVDVSRLHFLLVELN